MSELFVCFNFERGYEIKVLEVDAEDTMDQVAEKAAQIIVGYEVPPNPGGILRVRRQDEKEPHPRDMKVKDTGWTEMEPLVIYYE